MCLGGRAVTTDMGDGYAAAVHPQPKYIAINCFIWQGGWIVDSCNNGASRELKTTTRLGHRPSTAQPSRVDSSGTEGFSQGQPGHSGLASAGCVPLPIYVKVAVHLSGAAGQGNKRTA